MASDRALTIECVTEGSVRITLAGELDLTGENALVDAVSQALAGGSPRGVVVDLAKVTFMDSSGLRALLICREKAQERGRSFRIAACSDPVHRLLDVAGVADRFAYE